MYIQSLFISSLITHNLGLPTQFWFNVAPVSQPIAGSMPTDCLRRWPSTTPTLDLLYISGSTPRKMFSVGPTSSTQARN